MPIKPGFHIAVRCRKAAAGIAGTIAAGMPPACRNHFNLYGNHFSRYRRQPQPSLLRYRNDLEKVESFQLCSILTASSAMKIYMETGCLRQPPANHCLSLFCLSLSSLYPLVTGIVTGILRHFSHEMVAAQYSDVSI